MVFQNQRQREGFSPFIFLHYSHRHTVFLSLLAINISSLFREVSLPCAYLCVDLWLIRNHRADLLGQLFKGKREFMLSPHLPVLCATHSAAQIQCIQLAKKD